MRKIVAVTVMMCLIGIPSVVVSQEMFTGAGIRTAHDKSGGGQGNWFQFGQNRTASSNPNDSGPGYRMPWLTQDQNQRPTDDETIGAGLFGLPRPNLMHERDPDEPGLFQSANQRSKEFFHRTGNGISNWASRTGDSIRNTTQNIRETTFETWESITQSIPPAPWSKSDKKNAPIKPPLRSTDNWMSKNRDR